ncbi:putative pentatricopeptide repeat-containing protein At1g17630 [Salvia hispanica]|uniref:putative pentatricopeptide repeat-containing protein At1g17630 n=1 Tax=Salvia hispanica TaxID=49212 RepID=UPI00200986F6|nr:putative pentatricopeptide repeat-containing protein At1g17630 [Salvia hispanica]
MTNLPLLLNKRFFPLPFKFLTPFAEAIHVQSGNSRVDFFDRLLQHCISKIDERFNLDGPVKQIHAQISVTSSFSSAFLSARLVSAYAKATLLSDARKVFDNCPRDCFCSSLFWNSMLRAYLSDFKYESAVELYFRMREVDLHPDKFGFPLIIRACAMIGGVRLCELVHSHAVRIGISSNLHVGNELMGMYGEIGVMGAALKVFDRMPLRSRVSWNVVVSGFAKNFDCEGAVGMLHRMEGEGWEANPVTWTSVISSFAKCGIGEKAWEFYGLMRERGVDATAESVAVVISVCDGEMAAKGEIVHCHVIRGGFEEYIFVSNALMSMYGRIGDVGKAEFLFSSLKLKSLVSWNALISAYARTGLCDDAFSVFLRLESSNVVRPNVVSWTAVIGGFAASEGRKEAALELFRRMQSARVRPNSLTVASVLSSCGELSALSLGREIHSHAIRLCMDEDLLVMNGLINMYMKCGNLRAGEMLFKKMEFRDVISWNIMITGYGMHGLGLESLDIFEQMVEEGVKPDEVTFVGVLSACSHAGLVPEGRKIFNHMSRVFKVEPGVEHYSCMVDMLGRAGLLEEARGVLKSMPMEPNAPVWGAMLSSCEMHRKVDDAEESAAVMFDMNSGATGGYMLLSNLYATSGRWDEAAGVRTLARAKGLRKVPAQSWIEVKKKVHSFSVGRGFEMDMGEVYLVLQDLNMHMVRESYAPPGFVEAS